MNRAPSVTLAEIARRIGGRVVGDGSIRVTGMTHDSRRVEGGDVFAAVPGFELDGHDFVDAAVAAGAVGAIVSRLEEWPVTVILVDDVRQAMGPAAHAIHGDPSREMTVVGITGTNGKTTTTFLTAAVLSARFVDVAVLGTLGLRRDGRTTETGFTTPEATDLAKRLRELADEGVEAIAMEVSSHAIELGRIRGVEFAAGAFTNLGEEHLDFHGTFEEYGETKLDFFRRLAEQEAFGVVNADDPWGARFLEAGPERTWRFSLSDPEAEVVAEALDIAPDSTRVTIRTPTGRFETRLALAGRFNVANALAAAAIGIGLEIAPEDAGEALASVEHVPGRYEVHRASGVTAVVDYAHTPMAFERILRAVRESGPRRLLCIFGCGGERDRGKRSVMARIAGELADVVYVTVDNPRRESVERIMADTLPGFDGTSARWERIDDRREAIRRAIEKEAEPGDVVCVLGKGDESYQWIGDRKLPWSDRDEVRRALEARKGVRA